MHRRLLDLLCDPDTGESFSLRPDSDSNWIETGELVTESGRSYPIRKGVPRFAGDGYSESFGLQWNRFARVQLDSANGANYSRDRFRHETGWTAVGLTGHVIVDAGCGSGRFAEVAAQDGAEVIAVDLSTAVDAAVTNLRSYPNAHVIQADITHLPLKAALVQDLYSIGVLQHTPDPLLSVRTLVAFLPPGARFALTIYGRRPWTKLNTKYLIRPLTKRIRPGRLLKIIEKAVPPVFTIAERLASLPLVGRLFRFLLPVAVYPEQVKLDRRTRRHQSVLDTFDMLSPQHDHPVTVAEVLSAIKGIASADVVSEIPVVVRGIRISPGT